MKQLGLILTSAHSLASLQEHASALQADVVKVITGWGLPWSAELRHAALRLAPATIVRTVHGDPSVSGGRHRFLHPEHVIAEIRPWWEARDPSRQFLIEPGNEQLLQPEPDDWRALEHGYYLDRAIAACRAAFPGAQLIAPAHTLNYAVAVGGHEWGQERYLELHKELYRRCDFVGLHAYTVEQYARGAEFVRKHVGEGTRLYLTEFALNERLDDVIRGRRYAELLRLFDVAGACLYHLDELGGTDPAHFRAEYRLSVATLASLAAAWRQPATPIAPAPAKPAPAPVAPVKPFAAQIEHWPTVEAFAAHLAKHSPSVCSWVRGITLHHTIRPGLKEWYGRPSVERLLRYYRDEAPWKDDQGRARKGWSSGPHLFLAPDGVWQLTPLNLRGTHAVSFNQTHWGWEVVGQYDLSPWSPAMRELVEGSLAVGLRWLGKPAGIINGHRDDPTTTKSCPGRAIDLNVVRANVARRMGGR